ncbi:MAG: hypothetical protein ACXABY_32285, partial [Candidatus Thorarchaeota archaeon]
MFSKIDDDSLERLRRVAINNRLSIDDHELSPEVEAERLRDGLSGRFYSSAKTWMLPFWARLQKQKSPLDENGVSNDHFRNWTLVGSPGAKKYAVTDESGIV